MEAATTDDYRSLSVRDLLAAREQYHWHLANRQNVVGTAVGLYLIRQDDPWPQGDESTAAVDKSKRTLDNSEVRPYSWPCVLVFVDKWVDEAAFGSEIHPLEMIPKTLYLPDGRTVPVCVVAVDQAQPAQDRSQSILWPSSGLGGGLPILSRSQHLDRAGSVGCLVTDGHTYYALTNRHVCGEVGERISVRLRGGDKDIGAASPNQLTRQPFCDVYSTFAGTTTWLNLDVGLVTLDDVTGWTASFYGLGDVGPLADLNEANISFGLIDQPVAAWGAASGQLKGTIKAFFYRYKSVGGFDYVSDLLIAPAKRSSSTKPGDSGTVWHLQSNAGGARKSLHPVAVEWGAQAFSSSGETLAFALASNLSTVLRLLDVELVVHHNIAAQPFWGITGHYSIAGTAVANIQNVKLKQLMDANAGNIAFDRSDLAGGQVAKKVDAKTFVPLADVPDLVWKKTPWTLAGGRDTSANVGPEHPNHFCDIDRPGPDGTTLRARCIADPNNVAISVWQDYYTSTGHTKPAERGCLPFRVWQIYDAMLDQLKNKDYPSFVSSAGVLAHYVGDACQPLHASYLADGYSDQATQHTTTSGKTVMTWPGEGVHSAYESTMIDRHASDLFTAIDAELAQPDPGAIGEIHTGHDAAVECVRLMERTATTLAPTTLIDRYIALGSGTSHSVIDGLWNSFGAQTASIMTDGIRLLIAIWTAAWVEAGTNPDAGTLQAIDPAALRKLYSDATFLPSLDLDHIASALDGP